MNKKYKNEILHMIHDEAIANYEVGAITREELEEYDRACLVFESFVLSSVPSSGVSK